MALQTSPALSGLARLADRTGLDIRPTLLRVLTDLYVLKPAHTDEEERHYVELAMRLIDGVDVGARVALAERLSKFSGAPRAIVQRLARDVFDVASVVLTRSDALDQSELIAIAEECGPAYAAIVAQRPDIQALLETGPSIAPEAEIDVASVVETAAMPVVPADIPIAPMPEPLSETPGEPDTAAPIAVTPNELADASPAPVVLTAATASRLSDLFLISEPAERHVILLNLEFSPIPPAEAVTETRSREAIRKLERAALSRQPRAFATVLSECLGLSMRLTQDLVEDATGEPIVVLAKALRMPSDILQRVLLFLNPAIGESVKQVYDLATLYEELSLNSVLRLIAIWKAGDTRKLVRHETALWDDEIARARASVRPLLRSAAERNAAQPPRRSHGGLAVRG